MTALNEPVDNMQPTAVTEGLIKLTSELSSQDIIIEKQLLSQIFSAHEAERCLMYQQP